MILLHKKIRKRKVEKTQQGFLDVGFFFFLEKKLVLINVEPVQSTAQVKEEHWENVQVRFQNRILTIADTVNHKNKL